MLHSKVLCGSIPLGSEGNHPRRSVRMSYQTNDDTKNRTRKGTFKRNTNKNV